MKKNLFMAALALAAGTAFAAAQTDYSGVYSGELTVSLGAGTPEDKNIEIYPGSQESSVTFVLPDFTFMNIPLGDIVLTDIPVTDGNMTLEDYPLLMTALGNMIVTVDMTGTFAEQLTASLTIDVPNLMPVPVSFTGTRTLATNEGAYQVRNSGFEGEWDKVSGKGGLMGSTNVNGVEPQHWNSFVTAQVGSGFGLTQAVNGDQLKESSLVRPGSVGSKSALVVSKLQLGSIPANGNLTTGRINAGAMQAANSANHNFSDPTANDNDDFLCPFVGAPDSLVIWAKYKPADGNIENEVNQASVSAIIHNGQRYQDPEDSVTVDGVNTPKYDTVKVAVAKRAYPAVENYDWQRISTSFEYNFLPKDSAKYILVNISTNVTPGGGSSTKDNGLLDSLWVDDLEMVYNSRLSSLTVGDETVSLAEGMYEYDLTQTLAADVNPAVEATVDGKAASYVTGFNRADNTAAVIVRGGDFAANPANVHTYTLRFAEPQGPGTGFDTPVVPQVSLYTEGNMLYILSAEAVQVEVYAVDGRMLTLTTEKVISLPANGVYVVRVNGETHKVVAQ